MRKLSIVAVLGCGLAVGACGGSSGAGAPQARPARSQDLASTPVRTAAAPRSHPSRARTKQPARHTTHATHRPAAHRPTVHRHVATAPRHAAAPGQRHDVLAHALKRSSRLRRSFVAKHALALLQLLGIQHAEVRTDPTGTGVTVLVPAADACGHSRTAEAQIQSGIRKAFSFVRRVGVLVGSQDFAAYTTAHCKAVALPDVAGKLVYSASGHTGDTTTPAFQIARSHWTVVYENDSSYMAMFVLEDDQYTKQVFSTQSSGTGKLTFTGTGSFKLRISDAGDWQIKVYD